MILHDLIENIDFISIKGSLNIEIDGIAYDSRTVSKKYLFVCMDGYLTDGHYYIKEAMGQGAVAIIIEKPDYIGFDIDFAAVTVIQVKNSRNILPIISARFYNKPTNMLKLIGITGTNGKTSTAYLVKSIFESWGKKVGLLGTIAIEIGEKKVNSQRTTPESLDLQGIFREMVNIGIEYCVMEVSSHSLTLGRVEECNFHIGAFTNLSPEHLDFHEDMESYRKTKEKLFFMTNFTNIINADDREGRKIIQNINKMDTPLLTFGIDQNAYITAKNIDINSEGVSFELITPDYMVQINGNVPGLFSVYNCLTAASIAYAEGVCPNAICKGIENFHSVPGRMEKVDIDTPYKVIIDYAHTPDGLENVLRTIKAYAKKRIITVFGCGGDRDKKKRAIMGEIAGIFSDYCILTSDNPRTENPYEIIEQIEKGIANTGCGYICIESRKEAIKEAMRIAQEDDIILLAGKGHERYQELNGITVDFDERKIVKDILFREEG